ncbi:MAG: GTP-binding protein, partial [Clostridia bacterium]|nr:GTP-binding protein [Clostridia bacterium]
HEHHHDHGEECGCGHHHEHEHNHDHSEECGCGHHHHHGHDADEVFTSWGVETACKYTQEQITDILQSLDGGEYGVILRAKGIVSASDGKWIHFDYVPEEVDVRYGGGEVIGRICVIGSKINKQKLAELFGVKA